MASDISRPALAELLAFTPDDLAANREGRLSERQRERLRAARRRAALVVMAILVLVGIAAAVLLYIGQSSGSLILGFVGIGVTVCNAALMGVLVRNYARLTADIDGGQVTALEGSVHHTIRVTGRLATYILSVDGTELSIAKPVFLAIPEGARCRFYRTPAAKTLLSAEILDASETP
jgi:hypothetical protein